MNLKPRLSILAILAGFATATAHAQLQTEDLSKKKTPDTEAQSLINVNGLTPEQKAELDKSLELLKKKMEEQKKAIEALENEEKK